jgi:hypothetical protein
MRVVVFARPRVSTLRYCQRSLEPLAVMPRSEYEHLRISLISPPLPKPE